MSLLDQSLLWLSPYALLMLFMVHAMTEYTLSLLIKRPPGNPRPVTVSQLRQRLLALNEVDQPYRLVEGQDCDLEMHWNIVDQAWQQRFARVKLTTFYRARFLFDESRHELRLNEYMRTGSFFLGFDGWLPRCQWYYSFSAGILNGNWVGQAYGILSGQLCTGDRLYYVCYRSVRLEPEQSADYCGYLGGLVGNMGLTGLGPV